MLSDDTAADREQSRIDGSKDRNQAPAAGLLRRLKANWDEWLFALAGLPVSRLTEPGVAGDWSVHDLMGHVAVWEGLALDRTRRLITGEVVERVDWRTINSRGVAERAGRSGMALRADMERTHGQLVAFIGGLTRAELRMTGLRSRLRSTATHSQEHAAQVRAWRGRVGL